MIDPAITNSEPPREPKPFQFGLKHLFGLTLAVCIFLALATQGDIFGVLLFLLLASIVAGIWLRQPLLYVGGPLVTLGITCLLPTVSRVTPATLKNRMQKPT